MSENIKLKVVLPDNKENSIEINEHNIIKIILKLMENVESFIDMNGQQKKYYVLDSVKSLLGDETYDRYKYFISSFIDLLITHFPIFHIILREPTGCKF